MLLTTVIHNALPRGGEKCASHVRVRSTRPTKPPLHYSHTINFLAGHNQPPGSCFAFISSPQLFSTHHHIILITRDSHLISSYHCEPHEKFKYFAQRRRCLSPYRRLFRLQCHLGSLGAKPYKRFATY